MEKSFYDLPAEEVLRNTKTKIYPDGSTSTTYCNQYIFIDQEIKEKYKDEIEQKKAERKSQKEQKKNKDTKTNVRKNNIDNRERDDSIKRSRDKVFDIARLNQFEYFVTITFAGSEYEFENPEFVIKKVRNYLQNKVQRTKNTDKPFKYLLIPEKHKRGGIHCHALVSNIDLIDSGTRLVYGYSKPVKLDTVAKRNLKEKAVVYNIPSWKYGFSTAIKIDSSNAFAFYITKYIVKGNKKIFGQYYWSSRNCVREPQVIYHNTDFYSVNRSAVSKPWTSVKYKYNSNSFFIPEFDKLSSKFDDISDFLDYVYSDEYKKEYENYVERTT